MTVPSQTEPTTRERILDIATVLFAEHGYDGVTTRELAAAVGLNIATVHYHVGTKRELYVAVFDRLVRREEERFAAALGELDPEGQLPDRAALRPFVERLVDVLVSLVEAEPAATRLWVRRWLEDDESDVDIETTYVLPTYRRFSDLLRRIEATVGVAYRGPDEAVFLKSVAWIVYGFVLDGPLDDPAHAARRADRGPDGARLRRFLTDHLCRNLGIP